MLQGPRVQLRALERGDLDRLHTLANREIGLFMLAASSWRPNPRARSEGWFDKELTNAADWRFVIEADGKVIGDVGLHPWAVDHRSGSCELGILILDPEYIGKGYGREALDLFLEWVFVVQNFRRIGLSTLASNERAQRLYRSLGFVHEGRLRQQDWYDGHYVDIVVMGLLRTEWERRERRPRWEPKVEGTNA
ncbi:MAG: spermidine N1-acetyltransferase [Herpetosiphon sp.]